MIKFAAITKTGDLVTEQGVVELND